MRKSALSLLFAFAIAVFAVHVLRHRGELLDDTFISFRYARNLVAGHGLVFNPGERVEGYTNFLFVMAAAACLALGLDPLAGTGALVALAALATLLAVRRLERLGPAASGPSIALLLVLPLEGFAYWSVVSFETMLFTALLVWSLVLLLREVETGQAYGAAPAFVLLALTRPEGVLAFAVANAAVFVADAQRFARWRRYLARGLVFGVLYGAYFGWRWSYYGHLVPNTFVAKVTSGSALRLSGLLYLADWARAVPLLALAAAAPLLLLSVTVRATWRARPTLVVVPLVALAFMAYTVAVGGDSFPFHRFFVPVVPLLAVVAAWTLWTLVPGRHLGAAAAVAVLATVVTSHLTDEPYRAFVAHRTTLAGEHVGAWLAKELPPDALIAVNTVGTVPYYAGLPTIDMLGLTDDSIARRPVWVVSPGWAGHRRGWGAYVLERRPEVIIWYNTAGAAEPFYLGDRELAADPIFRFFYQLRHTTLPGETANGGEGRVVARFLGFPFGTDPSGSLLGADLGVRATFHSGLVDYTVLGEAPIGVYYFAFDHRDDDLWSARARYGHDAAALVDAAAATWRTADGDRPPPDPAARASVLALCDEAHRMIEAKDFAQAKALLGRAVAENAVVRVPLVYQYVANVGAITGEVLTAVGAQKEALRLAPDNALYRENLVRLLETPWVPRAATP